MATKNEEPVNITGIDPAEPRMSVYCPYCFKRYGASTNLLADCEHLIFVRLGNPVAPHSTQPPEAFQVSDQTSDHYLEMSADAEDAAGKYVATVNPEECPDVPHKVVRSGDAKVFVESLFIAKPADEAALVEWFEPEGAADGEFAFASRPII